MAKRKKRTRFETKAERRARQSQEAAAHEGAPDVPLRSLVSRVPARVREQKR